jgi:predicted HTH domain antitoxin
MGVISLRLKDRDLERLDELSKALHKDKSTMARELLEYGWDFLMLEYYKQGKLSLSGLAKKLDVSISEAIDLLKERGIEAPIAFDDYLKGFEVFDRVKCAG